MFCWVVPILVNPPAGVLDGCIRKRRSLVANPAPVAPVGPVAPVAPVAPVCPVGPVAPVAPVGPVGPVAPVAPVGPVGPVGPVAPIKLKRLMVPRCPLESITTGAAPGTLTPLMPAMNVAVCTDGAPMRIVLDSPATSVELPPFKLPISMRYRPW